MSSLFKMSALAGILVSGMLLSFGWGGPAWAFTRSAPSKAAPSDSASSAGAGASTGAGATIWVAKSDGAQQCAPKSGTGIEAGASMLEQSRIRVLGSRKGSDGKMRAQVCGIPAGSMNVYQISKDDLSRAKALGYQEVTKRSSK